MACDHLACCSVDQKRKGALLFVLPIAELHAPVQSLRLSYILSHYGACPLDPHLWAQAEVEQQLDCPMRRYLSETTDRGREAACQTWYH